MKNTLVRCTVRLVDMGIESCGQHRLSLHSLCQGEPPSMQAKLLWQAELMLLRMFIFTASISILYIASKAVSGALLRSKSSVSVCTASMSSASYDRVDNGGFAARIRLYAVKASSSPTSVHAPCLSSYRGMNPRMYSQISGGNPGIVSLASIASPTSITVSTVNCAEGGHHECERSDQRQKCDASACARLKRTISA